MVSFFQDIGFLFSAIALFPSLQQYKDANHFSLYITSSMKADIVSIIGVFKQIKGFLACK